MHPCPMHSRGRINVRSDDLWAVVVDRPADRVDQRGLAGAACFEDPWALVSPTRAAWTPHLTDRTTLAPVMADIAS